MCGARRAVYHGRRPAAGGAVRACARRGAAQDAVEQRVTVWAGPKHTRKNLRAMLSTFDTVSSPPHPTPPAAAATAVRFRARVSCVRRRIGAARSCQGGGGPRTGSVRLEPVRGGAAAEIRVVAGGGGGRCCGTRPRPSGSRWACTSSSCPIRSLGPPGALALTPRAGGGGSLRDVPAAVHALDRPPAVLGHCASACGCAAPAAARPWPAASFRRLTVVSRLGRNCECYTSFAPPLDRGPPLGRSPIRDAVAASLARCFPFPGPPPRIRRGGPGRRSPQQAHAGGRRAVPV